MARAIANCTCGVCGNKFQKVAFRYDRAEAESWREWAEEHINVCPECYQKQQAEKGKKLAEELGLPQITGKSEKQIAYATSLRSKFLLSDEDAGKKIKRARKMMSVVTPEQICEAAEKSGITSELYIQRAMESRDLYEAYVVAYKAEAGQIIDTLKYSNSMNSYIPEIFKRPLRG